MTATNAPAYYALDDLKYITKEAETVEAGSAISNGREPKSCLGRVFNFKLGCFGEQKHE